MVGEDESSHGLYRNEFGGYYFTAMKFGYQSPEASAQAFKNLHGIMPISARDKGVLKRMLNESTAFWKLNSSNVISSIGLMISFLSVFQGKLNIVANSKTPPRLSPYLMTWLHSLEGVLTIPCDIGHV